MGFSTDESGYREKQQHLNNFEEMSKRGALACMVNTEVGAVLAVMRRNARWAGTYMSGDDQLEHSLIHSLKSLRKKIFSWHDEWQQINPSMYLKPFLDVIRSDETGAPITGVALSAIYKILTMEVFDLNTIHVEEAMHSIVDAVTSCRFEVTDSASEEVVLMKILQVLLACMKCKNSVVLSNQDVCTIVNTCFRVVHQAGTKGELLQRTARQTMHELVRTIFARLLDFVPGTNCGNQAESSNSMMTSHAVDCESRCETENNNNPLSNGETNSSELKESLGSNIHSPVHVDSSCHRNDAVTGSGNGEKKSADDTETLKEPNGITAIIEIFQFLCSLLNVDDTFGVDVGPTHLAFEEDVPLFALGLINSAIELGGPAFRSHPKLLALIQDDLFSSLMRFGLSPSPLILSTVCSIALNLYHHLRKDIKLQLEAFFTCVIIRLAQGKHGASYQQQEVAMEAMVDFCRQPTFVFEMYANFDCEITCSNIFEDVGNALSKSAFPLSLDFPLSSMHILALEGLIALVQNMVERTGTQLPGPDLKPIKEIVKYEPFWTSTCDNYEDPSSWVTFVCQKKYLKRKLMVGVDHFNREPKKGLEFLKSCHLLPDHLEPKSVAWFFRYTPGLDKSSLGDFLGNHDEFWVSVLHEFAKTFDFTEMSIDMALRTFLETFRLPGESQKIQRVLEAFAERYFEESPQILVDKDAAFILAYSLILLNTDRHNAQVKKKMSEEDFIKNNRRINGGNDLPREMLSELYHSILTNEIRTQYEHSTAIPEMTPSRWVDLIRKSRSTSPYIMVDSVPLLDQDMFIIISGPTIAAMSVIFDNANDEEILQTCIDGFQAVAKLAAFYHLEHVLDDLVVSLCKFTTLLNTPASLEEPILLFGDDMKTRIVTVTVFMIANKYGDHIRTGWRNIIDCIIRLHKLGLLPSSIGSDGTEDSDGSSDSSNGKASTSIPVTQKLSAVPAKRKSSSLMGRFSQFLYFDSEETRSQPTEQELAAQQRAVGTIQQCNISSIFKESKFLQAQSLEHLARALIWAAGKPQKGSEDEDTSVFCLQLLIVVTLNNRDRIMILWQGVHDYIANIVQTIDMPCALVEKAVFGLLRVCQRLLPYKENLAEELLRSLQLILKLDARVADVYCERITQEIMQLVKANAGHIKSLIGWRTVASLLSITARHPEASEPGFEALSFIMVEGAHLNQVNYCLCIDAARAFAESRIGTIERSLKALDLIAGSVKCLAQWSKCVVGEYAAIGVLQENNLISAQDVRDMWQRLLLSIQKICLDQRGDVRNHAILSLQRCLSAVDASLLQIFSWSECFERLIFKLLDDLFEISQVRSSKEYKSMEVTLQHAIKLMSKFFLQVLDQLSSMPNFESLWFGVLTRMEKYMKAKLRGRGVERIQELLPELLKNMLLILKARGLLIKTKTNDGKSLWEMTWVHVQEISPDLMNEIFPDHEVNEKIESTDGTSTIKDSNVNDKVTNADDNSQVTG